MINKLTVDQISSIWDYVRFAVDEALPPTASTQRQRLGNILTALMSGVMECWAVYEKNEEDKKITLYAVILTLINSDECSGSKQLVVYAMASMGFEIPRRLWKEGITGLVKYAEGKGCERVVAYTNLDSMKNFFRLIGGEAEYTLLSLPVESFDPGGI